MERSDIKNIINYVVEEDLYAPENISVVLTVELHNQLKNQEVPYLVVNYSDGEYYSCMLWNSNYDWIDYDLSEDVVNFALEYVKENVELSEVF